LNDFEVNELIDIVNALRDEGTGFLWVEHVVRALTATADRVMCSSPGHLLRKEHQMRFLSIRSDRELFGSPAFMKERP